VIEERLADLVLAAVAAADLGIEPGDIPAPEILTPKQKEHGDFATNIALVLANKVGRTSRDVAAAILDALPADDVLEKAEIAGPGFLNLFVRDDWLYDVLREVVARGTVYGRAEPNGISVQVEFLSANPTGPLHIGHARNMVLGDAIANLLEFTGWTVQREYYFNDAGRQMELFGASVEARYLQAIGRHVEVPEDGYHGAYLIDVAADIVAEHGDAFADLPETRRLEACLREGARRVLDQIKATLARFGVRFDVFFSEQRLHEAGEIAETVERLRSADLAYEGEGAVWFRSTRFGDDKDRVLIRSNGTPTYFAADCAYLVDKFRRGFDHLVYVWGADHHGDIARVKGTAEGLGYDPARVEIVLYQFVSLVRGGETMKMSKRAGDIVTLDELADEVGTDATRFTLLSQSNDSAINFDIEIVKRQSMDNPVYYVQYGHARIASILRTATERGVVLRPIEEANLGLLTAESELDLLRSLADAPAQIAAAAGLRAPARLTHASQDLAARFHRFYAECRVVSEDEELTQARLWLCAGTKQVIANVLALLGVSAPESMERTDG
jgi:arginyl-tRNA synthetase